MYNSGDAAEQVVRISLEGTEVALKLTGSAAKNIAAMLYAVWKNRDKNKTKGHQRLSAMLKSGKELKVFTVSEEHLKQFATEAKRYGVVYCALRGKERSADGMVDIMVRAEDASKINRIVERFKLATVDTVSIKRDIEQSKADKTASSAPEQEKPDKAADDRHEPPCNEVDAHVGDGGGREARQKAHPRAVGQPCRQLHRHGRNDERQHLHDGQEPQRQKAAQPPLAGQVFAQRLLIPGRKRGPEPGQQQAERLHDEQHREQHHRRHDQHRQPLFSFIGMFGHEIVSPCG